MRSGMRLNPCGTPPGMTTTSPADLKCAPTARANQLGDGGAIRREFRRILQRSTGHERPATLQDVVHLGDIVMHDGAYLPLGLERAALEDADRDIGALADVDHLDLLVDTAPQGLVYGIDLGSGHISGHARLRKRHGREHRDHRHHP